MIENNDILERAIGPKYNPSGTDVEGNVVRSGSETYTQQLPLTENAPIHPDSLHHIPENFVKKPVNEDKGSKEPEKSHAAKWLTDHLKPFPKRS